MVVNVRDPNSPAYLGAEELMATAKLLADEELKRRDAQLRSAVAVVMHVCARDEGPPAWLGAALPRSTVSPQTSYLVPLRRASITERVRSALEAQHDPAVRSAWRLLETRCRDSRRSGGRGLMADNALWVIQRPHQHVLVSITSPGHSCRMEDGGHGGAARAESRAAARQFARVVVWSPID